LVRVGVGRKKNTRKRGNGRNPERGGGQREGGGKNQTDLRFSRLHVVFLAEIVDLPIDTQNKPSTLPVLYHLRDR
jgi:hypothetical protein